MANLELKTASGGSVTLAPQDGTVDATLAVENKNGTVALREETVRNNFTGVQNITGNTALTCQGFRAGQGAPNNVDDSTNGYGFRGDGDTGMFSRFNGDLSLFSSDMEVMRKPLNSGVFFYKYEGGHSWNHQSIVVETIAGTGIQEAGIGFHSAATTSAGIFKFYGGSNRFECRNGGNDGFVDIAVNAVQQTSDYRLKENISDIQNALDVVNNLRPVSFKFKDKEHYECGFIAHEIQEHIDCAVSGEKDGVDENDNPVYQTVDYSKMIPMLVGAVKELTNKVNQLESEIAQLKGV